MKNKKPKNHTKAKILLCDRSDKKNYLVPYKRLKFYVKHGMTVDKIHEINSFKQNMWLRKSISFITQKRNRAKIEFEKNFYKLLNKAF